MTEALKDIAKSGKNNTVIYIPVGPDGLPVVADTSQKGAHRCPARTAPKASPWPQI
ncbi:hypothetical protein ACQEVG_14330 [Streptomyces sp. CA-135486]|uniref:hypothetical protein n=1 Tax=Streptomyces sp. CA-135486 TaxID=3240049 RepID=UPI003D8AC770